MSSEWVAVDKGHKYPVYDDKFKIKSEVAGGRNKHIYFTLYDDSGDSTVFVKLGFKEWSYYISSCTSSSDNLMLTNVPSRDGREWEVKATTTYLKIECNEREALKFVYTDEYRSGCMAKAKGKTITAVKIAFDDDATSEFYFESRLYSIVVPTQVDGGAA